MRAERCRAAGRWRAWGCPYVNLNVNLDLDLFSYLTGTVLPRRREGASLRLGAWGAALAQGVCLYALGVLGAACVYAGYATFAHLVQARALYPAKPRVAKSVLPYITALSELKFSVCQVQDAPVPW